MTLTCKWSIVSSNSFSFLFIKFCESSNFLWKKKRFVLLKKYFLATLFLNISFLGPMDGPNPTVFSSIIWFVIQFQYEKQLVIVRVIGSILSIKPFTYRIRNKNKVRAWGMPWPMNIHNILPCLMHLEGHLRES